MDSPGSMRWRVVFALFVLCLVVRVWDVGFALMNSAMKEKSDATPLKWQMANAPRIIAMVRAVFASTMAVAMVALVVPVYRDRVSAWRWVVAVVLLELVAWLTCVAILGNWESVHKSAWLPILLESAGAIEVGGILIPRGATRCLLDTLVLIPCYLASSRELSTGRNENTK